MFNLKLNKELRKEKKKLELKESKMAEFSASFKTVLNWEKEFGCELDKLIEGGKVVSIKCKTCQKYESRLKNMRSWTSKCVQGSKFLLLGHINKYPEKRKKVGESTCHAIDISKDTLSDLENDSSDSGENDW